VDQLLTLIDIVVVNAIVAAPIVAIVAFLRRGVSLDEGIPLRYAELNWPRGVQEEDPPRWRVELAQPIGRSVETVRRPVPATRPAPATRPVPAIRPVAASRPVLPGRVAQGCEVAAAR
jgi:hypothetical protein